MKTYTREDLAELWLTGLDDRERRSLVEQFEEQHGGVAIAPPSPLELFDSFNAGAIHLEHGTPSGRP